MSKAPRIDEIRGHMEAIARLRSQISEHQAAIRKFGGSTYETVIAAYKDDPRVYEIAARFGITPETVRNYRRRYWQETGEKLPRSIAPRGKDRKQMARRRDPAPIIEAYKKATNFLVVAAMFGVSSERIRKIIVAHEKATGQKLPRYKQTLKRIFWACPHCGTEYKIKPSGARACRVCVGLRSRGGRFDDPVLLEDWIARRKTGASWQSLGRDVGVKPNAIHTVIRAIWQYLRRERREAEVVEIWRGASTRWLEKKWPMRTEGPRVPTRPVQSKSNRAAA